MRSRAGKFAMLIAVPPETDPSFTGHVPPSPAGASVRSVAWGRSNDRSMSAWKGLVPLPGGAAPRLDALRPRRRQADGEFWSSPDTRHSASC